MSSEAVGIGTPLPAGISGHDRRWAVLQWLSVKLRDGSHSEILRSAKRVESFVVGSTVSRQHLDAATSNVDAIEPASHKGGVRLSAREERDDEADIPAWMDRR